MAFILDASVALSWLFADELTDWSAELLERATEQGVVVPAHWSLETVNGALMGERRGRVSAQVIARWLEQLSKLQIRLDPVNNTSVFKSVLPLCRKHRLTTYDAAYLELGSRLHLPLATFDKKLADAARSVGVDVVAA